MTKKIPFIIFILLPGLFNLAQGQLVKDRFDKMNLSENFDSSSSMWTMVANIDNLFIVQEGEYILNRKTLVSPFAVVASYNNETSTFRLVSSLKLEKTANDEGSVGLLIMAQNDGKGGFIFEINKFKQYRIKQITGGAYKYISGDSKSNGWVKSAALSDLNLYNLIDIRTSNKNYDVYVNNTFLMSYTEATYSSGKLGVIIGPGSKAKVDFFYVFTGSKSSPLVADDKPGNEEKNSTGTLNGSQEPDIIILAESIIQLKTQINKLKEENEVLQQTIEAYKSDEKEAAITYKNQDRNLKILQDEMKKQLVKMDSLTKANNELLKFKELVGGNENSDLIITLSKTVKSEKAANEELRRVNKELSESLLLLKNDSKSTGEKPNKPAPSNQTPKSNKDSTTHKGFVLPNDGK